MDEQGWARPTRKPGLPRLLAAGGLIVAVVAGVGALVRMGGQPADGLGVTVEEEAGAESGDEDGDGDGDGDEDGNGNEDGDGNGNGDAAGESDGDERQSDGDDREADHDDERDAAEPGDGGGAQLDTDDGDPGDDGSEEAAGQWHAVPDPPVPRRHVEPVWTGDELVRWGGTIPPEDRNQPGQNRVEFFADGAAYDPGADRWRTLAPAPLEARRGHVSVWTGEELVVWGGQAATANLGDGAAYDPDADGWRRIADGPLSARNQAVGVWTGEEVLILGGWDNAGMLHDGAAYDPAADRWRVLAPPPRMPGAGPGPLPGRDPTSTWTGERLVIAARAPTSEPEYALLAYDPDEDSWSRLPEPPGPDRESAPTLTSADGRTAVVTRTSADEPRLHLLDPQAGKWRAVDAPGNVSGAGDQPSWWMAAWADGDLYLLDPAQGWGGFVVTVDTGRWRRLPAHQQAPGLGPGLPQAEAFWTGEALLTWSPPRSERQGGDPPESVFTRWEPAATR